MTSETMFTKLIYFRAMEPKFVVYVMEPLQMSSYTLMMAQGVSTQFVKVDFAATKIVPNQNFSRASASTNCKKQFSLNLKKKQDIIAWDSQITC
jgi:hypothetical protein